MTPSPPRRAPGPAEDNTYLVFIRGAFAAALLGGFVLAIFLPLANVLDWNWGTRWPALAQAHGHLQIVGWAGLFVFGMAYRLVPRVASAELRPRQLVLPSGALLAAGLVMRPFAQTWLDRPGMPFLLSFSAVMELLGGLAFATIVLATLAGRRRNAPSIVFFASGATWFAFAQTLQCVWLIDLALSQDAAPVLGLLHDDALVTLYFWGFALTFIFGVGLRTMPTFYAREMPGWRTALPLWSVLNAGLVLFVAARLWQTYGDSDGYHLANAGLALMGVAMAGGAWLTGGLRGVASRLRPSSQVNALFLRAMSVWLLVGGVYLGYVAVRALQDNQPVAFDDADAVRHILALGVITMMIVGMASLVTPVMAARRFGGVAATWLAWVALLLNLATVLRLTAALLDPVERYDERHWLMATAGILAIAAIALFARPFVLPSRTAVTVLPVGHPDAGDHTHP